MDDGIDNSLIEENNQFDNIKYMDKLNSQTSTVRTTLYPISVNLTGSNGNQTQANQTMQTLLNNSTVLAKQYIVFIALNTFLYFYII